jgi:hypothetical protein
MHQYCQRQIDWKALMLLAMEENLFIEENEHSLLHEFVF